MRARHIFLLSILSGTTGTSFAGDLGPTSRGAVSISITVPPHVIVTPVRSADGPLRPALVGGLCLATNGVERYHVDLLRPDGSLAQPLASGRSSPARTEVNGARACSLHQAIELTGKDLADHLALSEAPLTLVIVPE